MASSFHGALDFGATIYRNVFIENAPGMLGPTKPCSYWKNASLKARLRPLSAEESSDSALGQHDAEQHRLLARVERSAEKVGKAE